MARSTPALLQAFLNSRPRPGAKGYNHLFFGVLWRWSEWSVRQQQLIESRVLPRRQTATPTPFDPSQVRQLKKNLYKSALTCFVRLWFS
jgi:hypothetical protein